MSGSRASTWGWSSASNFFLPSLARGEGRKPSGPRGNFRLTLPAPPSDNGAGRCVVPKPLRLLLVEDDEGDAALLLWDLSQGGYEPTIHRVETVPAVREALASQTWDLVIADFC